MIIKIKFEESAASEGEVAAGLLQLADGPDVVREVVDDQRLVRDLARRGATLERAPKADWK